MEALEFTSETPERLWTTEMAVRSAQEIQQLASTARSSQVRTSGPVSIFPFLFISLASSLLGE